MQPPSTSLTYRSPAGPPSRLGLLGELAVGDLRIERESMTAWLRGKKLELTVQEYDLLLLLAQEVGRPIAHDRLALALWQEIRPGHERHISVLIARLRTKIAGSRDLRLETLRKRGYCLMPKVAGNRVEQIKRTKDGLDVLNDILRYARTGQAIDPDDAERMKWYGVFERKQTPGYFMFRLRVPNGLLTSQQIRTIGELSNRFGRGQVDVTTRQNLQLRWIKIEDVPAIFEVLDEAGLEYRQSGMDNVRNITGCPLAGFDPQEVIDASPVAIAVQQAIVGLHDFSNLPRKFNISISGCSQDCATSQTNDLSLTPALKNGRIGFNVKVGGMGGRAPCYASPLDAFVLPEHAAGFCAAVVSLYRDEGLRENRQNARLRFLIDDWGIETFRSSLEARFGPLQRAGVEQLESFAGDHIGVTPQKQPGLHTVGCLLPVGRVRGDDLIEFGRLAETCGSSELRLTNNQNLLIVNVPAGKLPGLLDEALLQRYSPIPPAWLRRTVSCTGKDFCHFARIDTKGHAVKFAQTMEELLPLRTPLRVNWSGCQHGCAQHYGADVGFMASRAQSGDDIVEAVDVFIGGRLGSEPELATMIMEAVPLDEVPQRLAAHLRQHPNLRKALMETDSAD